MYRAVRRFIRDSRIRFNSSLVPLGLLLCCVIFVTPAAGQTPTLEGAWSALWNNNLGEAETAFSAILDDDGSIVEARRGRILTRLFLGKDDGLAEDLKKYTASLPNSPSDMRLITLIDNHSGLQSQGWYELLFKYADKLADSGQLGLVDQRRALDLKVQWAVMCGKSGDAKKAVKKLNRIDEWALLGPFDNTSGCGHAKDHVDSWSVTQENHSGKFGQIINWFIPREVGLNKFFYPISYFHRQQYTTAYARSNVVIPEAGDYLISMSHVGDVDFYIDRTLIHEASRYNSGREDMHWLVNLPKGNHRLAFKVSNREDLAGFSCALSGSDGQRIGDLEVQVVRNAMVAASRDPDPRRQFSGSDAEIVSRHEAAPDDAEAALWYMQYMQSEMDPEEISSVCKATIEAFPENGILRLCAAGAMKALEAEDEFNALMAETTELAPEMAQAILFNARKDIEKKRYEDARKAAIAIRKYAPSCRGAQFVHMETMRLDERWEDMKTHAENLIDRQPRDSIGYQYLAAYYTARNDRRETIKYYGKVLKFMPPTVRALEEAVSGWAREDFGHARAHMKKLTELIPQDSNTWHNYLISLIATGEHQKAAELSSELLKTFPQNIALIEMKSNFVAAGAATSYDDLIRLFPNFQEVLREVYYGNRGAQHDLKLAQKRVGKFNNKLAADVLTLALNSEPANFRLRNRIRALRDERSYRSFLPDPDPKLIRARRIDPEDYPDADAVILLNQRRRFVFDGRASLSDRVIAVQMLNAAGIERWENFNLYFSSATGDVVFLANETLKADGSAQEAKRAYGTIVFKDLEPGDIVFLHFQETSFISGALAGKYWDQFHAAMPDDPTREARYSLILPEGYSANARCWHAGDYGEEDMPLQMIKIGGFAETCWAFHDLPPANEETLAPSSMAYLPWVDVSSVEAWTDIVDWGRDITTGQTEVTPRVQAKAEELTAGCATDDEKVAAILRFVSHEITYEFIRFFQSAYTPRAAHEILSDGFGDCKDKTCLMISLLKAVDVGDCYFSLVTPNSPRAETFLPSPRFNHVIVCREMPDGRRLWYDPTYDYSVPGQVPAQLAGVPTLVLKPGITELSNVGTTNIIEHPRRILTEVQLHSDGQATVNRSIRNTLIDATARLRHHLESTSRDELAKETAGTMAGQYPGVEVTSVDVIGQAELDSALTWIAEFTIPEFGQIDAGFLSCSLPWASHFREFFSVLVSAGERRTPIDLRLLNVCEDETVELDLPAGVSLAALPKDVEHNWRNCHFQTRWTKQAGGTLKVHRSLIIIGDIVSDTDYSGFKDFVDNVRRDMGRTHHLRLRS